MGKLLKKKKDSWKGSKRVWGEKDHNNAPTGPTEYRNRNKSSDLDSGQRKGPQGYPKYQEQAQNQKGVHTPVSGVTGFPGGKGTSRAGSYTKEKYAGKPLFSGKDHPAIEEHKRVLKEMREDKGDRKNLAEGGEVGCGPECGSPCDVHGDIVSKVLGKRMSQGGVVANEQGPGADELPNEFDYLALSGGLEDNSGPGNEHGDSSLFEDVVSRIMLKRKKQHNPSPA